MIVIALPTKEHLLYLRHVFEVYTRAGISPDELVIAADCYGQLQAAQDLGEASLGKAELVSAGPGQIAMEIPLSPEG